MRRCRCCCRCRWRSLMICSYCLLRCSWNDTRSLGLNANATQSSKWSWSTEKSVMMGWCQQSNRSSLHTFLDMSAQIVDWMPSTMMGSTTCTQSQTNCSWKSSMESIVLRNKAWYLLRASSIISGPFPVTFGTTPNRWHAHGVSLFRRDCCEQQWRR